MEYLELFYKVVFTNFLIVIILLLIDFVTDFSNVNIAIYNLIEKYATLTFLSVLPISITWVISLIWMG